MGTEIQFKSIGMRKINLPSHKLIRVNCSFLTENEFVHKVAEYIVV